MTDQLRTGPTAAPGADVAPIHPVDPPGTEDRSLARHGLRGRTAPPKAATVDVEGADSWETFTKQLLTQDTAGQVYVETIAPRDEYRRKIRISVAAGGGSLRISHIADALRTGSSNQRFATLAPGAIVTFEHRGPVYAAALMATVTFDVIIERRVAP